MRSFIIFAITVLMTACGGNPTISPTNPPQLQGPIVFVGDSITQFWDWGGFDTPEPALSVLVPGEINDGISGNRTSDMLARFDAVLAQHPAIVVILGGTNDIRQIEAPSIDNISEMAEQASAAGARIIIGTVPPASISLYPTVLDQTPNDAHIKEFNNQLRALAASYGYDIVDYYSVLINMDGSQNTDLFVSTDLIHPNHLGYNAMWSILKPLLR